VTARSGERGSHAGPPRGHSLPIPAPLSAPVPPPPGGAPPGEAPSGEPPPGGVPSGGVPPGGVPSGGVPSGGVPSGGETRARRQPRRPPRSSGSRHRKPSGRRTRLSRRQRMVAVLVLAVGLLSIGFATGFGSEASAEPTVQAFLLDWQQGKYAQAAALTTGDARQVTAQLAAAYTDLDATNTFLSMGPVAQHGNTAVASFKATVDLAQGGHQWTYTGRFWMTAKSGQWLVKWAPSVINPRLGPGDRLAVLTTFAPRAQVEDSAGRPLVTKSTDYHVGVYPGRLANVARTAAGFSRIAGLNGQQVLGQIRAAPPQVFLSLLTLEPDSFRSLWPGLDKVPGLSYQQKTEPLFESLAAEVVGQVGTENSDALHAEGAAYQPGETVGLSGLER